MWLSCNCISLTPCYWLSLLLCSGLAAFRRTSTARTAGIPRIATAVTPQGTVKSISTAANGPRTRFGRSHYKYSSSLTIPYKNSPFSSITYEGTSTTHAYISIQRTLTPAHVPTRPKNVFGLHRLLTKYRGRQVDSVICYEWYAFSLFM